MSTVIPVQPQHDNILRRLKTIQWINPSRVSVGQRLHDVASTDTANLENVLGVAKFLMGSVMAADGNRGQVLSSGIIHFIHDITLRGWGWWFMLAGLALLYGNLVDQRRKVRSHIIKYTSFMIYIFAILQCFAIYQDRHLLRGFLWVLVTVITYMTARLQYRLSPRKITTDA